MNKKPSNFIRWFTIITGVPAAFLFFRPKKYYYSEKSPHKLPKPCILMSNHISLMDFPLYLTVFPTKNVRFLMAEVLFRKNKMFSWLLYKLGGIYVDRDGFDFSFIGESLKVLDGGGRIGIFPESRLPVNGVPFPFKPSIAFIATKTDAPIIPVYTDGKYGKGRTRVMIGDPIYVKDYLNSAEPTEADIEKLTLILHDKVYELGDELHRRMEDEQNKKSKKDRH